MMRDMCWKGNARDEVMLKVVVYIVISFCVIFIKQINANIPKYYGKSIVDNSINCIFSALLKDNVSNWG